MSSVELGTHVPQGVEDDCLRDLTGDTRGVAGEEVECGQGRDATAVVGGAEVTEYECVELKLVTNMPRQDGTDYGGPGLHTGSDPSQRKPGQEMDRSTTAPWGQAASAFRDLGLVSQLGWAEKRRGSARLEQN